MIVQRQAEAVLGPDDVNWAKAMASATPVDPVAVASTDPLYLLDTSGTTGKPKGVVRDSGGYAVALAWSMRNVYDIGPGDTMFTASDVGWVVGHSYAVYGPLLAGATTVLYEGDPVGTPDAGQFWRVASECGAKTMLAAPAAVRAIRKKDPHGSFPARYDLSALRYLFLVGERLDPETYRWATESAGRPGDRSLVADRDRLAGGGQSGRYRIAAGEAGFPDPSAARLGRADPDRGRHAGARSVRTARSS